MPIEPSRLKKLAGSKQPPKGKRFGLAAKPKVLEEPEDEEAEEEASRENQVLEKGDGEKGTPKPAAVIPFLEQYATEVQACCDEVDYDLLIDPEMELDPENMQVLQEGALMLPPRLQRLLPNLAGIEYEDAAVIAAALEDREKIEDSQMWAGWIFRIGQMLSETDLEGGEEEAEEEEPE